MRIRWLPVVALFINLFPSEAPHHEIRWPQTGIALLLISLADCWIRWSACTGEDNVPVRKEMEMSRKIILKISTRMKLVRMPAESVGRLKSRSQEADT